MFITEREFLAGALELFRNSLVERNPTATGLKEMLLAIELVALPVDPSSPGHDFGSRTNLSVNSLRPDTKPKRRAARQFPWK